MVNIFSLARRIERPLILDGAMGSLLQQKGIKSAGKAWMAHVNIEKPSVVYDIHLDYINAGADIITTNTFRTNPLALSKITLSKNIKLVIQSVGIALEAAKDFSVFVAGSNAPAEDCYQVKRTVTKKELIYNHSAHINLLMSAGVDFILNETMSHFDEIKIICTYCSKENIPYIISLFLTEDLQLLSGEKTEHVIKYVLDHNPLAVGFNCIMPDVFRKLFKPQKLNFNWGAYLNCGSGDYSDNSIKCGVTPDDYGVLTKLMLKKNPSFIGACCGSSPSHIRSIRKIING
jgi:homocysteine S-methyltransferase